MKNSGASRIASSKCETASARLPLRASSSAFRVMLNRGLGVLLVQFGDVDEQGIFSWPCIEIQRRGSLPKSESGSGNGGDDAEADDPTAILTSHGVLLNIEAVMDAENRHGFLPQRLLVVEIGDSGGEPMNGIGLCIERSTLPVMRSSLSTNASASFLTEAFRRFCHWKGTQEDRGRFLLRRGVFLIEIGAC